MKKEIGIVFGTFILFFFSFSFGINYSMEERVSYDYAYSKGVTTIDNIDDANLYGNISRIELAKMISYYAINVLGKTPDTTKICEFGDISKELDEQYFNGVTKACQLGLMGVGIDDFYPNGKVSRAEFGTVLSRLLFNTPDGKDEYYSTHLAKLKSEGIISNDNPYFTDTRGYVMIMLMRSDNSSNNNSGGDFIEEGNGFIYRSKIVAWGNGNNYRNEEYGFHLNLPNAWNDCMIAHQQGINIETNKIENESFQLICPWKGSKHDQQTYIPDEYERLVDIIVVGKDTDKWTLDYLADQGLLKNNKYKFGFGITDASKDIFDGKVIPSDLECGKYPNCTCLQKESYQVGDFWDKVPNNYQEIGCFITTILKDHIEIFDI